MTPKNTLSDSLANVFPCFFSENQRKIVANCCSRNRHVFETSNNWFEKEEEEKKQNKAKTEDKKYILQSNG